MTPDSFVSLVCHDLRAPLRGLKSLPEWAREELLDELGSVPKGLDEIFDMMTKQADRLDAMVADLSRYSKLCRTDEEPVAEIEEALPGAELLDLFETRVAPLDDIPMEKDHLRIVFQELMDNAIKHGDGIEQRPTVSAEIVDGAFQVSVTDQGPGIEPRFLSFVFEPLRTLQSRDASEGSGVGLAMVARIAELYDADCYIQPNAHTPGVTATFRYPIPITYSNRDSEYELRAAVR